MTGEGKGAGIEGELGEICLVIMQVSPVDGRFKLSEEQSQFWKQFCSGFLSDVAFTDDVSDIVPNSGTDTAVAGDRGVRPGGALDGQGAIRQVILAEHLHMNPKFLNLISGEDAFQDIVRFPNESSEGNVEIAHPAVGGGFIPELPFVKSCYQSRGVGLPGLL